MSLVSNGPYSVTSVSQKTGGTMRTLRKSVNKLQEIMQASMGGGQTLKL